MPISGKAVAVGAAGLIYLWAAIKGASIQGTLRQLISGDQPTGSNIHPIDTTVIDTGSSGLTGNTGTTGVTATGSAANILSIAASMKGTPYCFGGGHGSNPCAACMDCSGYVSCVLNKAGVMKGSMATGALSGIGKGVPYDQRQPGDIIVWNGGTGGGHTGIIIDGSSMWNNPCTGCGGVQISRYPFGSRTAAAAVVRRVT